MSNQSRMAYWARFIPAERADLQRGLHQRGFACASERFAVASLGLVPQRIWEASVDADEPQTVRDGRGRRYEIRSRRLGDTRPFSRLRPTTFDVLVVCLWKPIVVAGRHSLQMECRTIAAKALPQRGAGRLNSRLAVAPVVATGIALS